MENPRAYEQLVKRVEVLEKETAKTKKDIMKEFQVRLANLTDFLRIKKSIQVPRFDSEPHGEDGMLYYDTTLKRTRIYHDKQWRSIWTD